MAAKSRKISAPAIPQLWPFISRDYRWPHRVFYNFHPSQRNTRRATGALTLTHHFPSVSSAAISDAPDRTVRVFAEQQTSVLLYRNANWAAPDITIRRYKSGYEILHLAAGFSALTIEGHAHDLIAGATRPIPRAMKGSENITVIFCRKLVAGVKT